MENMRLSMKINSFAVAVGFSALIASTSLANAYTPVWSVSGLYTDIVAADCRDCEENLGIIIRCTGNGQPAEITVNAAAAERGQDGAFSPATFFIDGKRFTYDAKTVEYGLIGFTPVFSIAKDDPLIEAFSAGENAAVSFNGQTGNIGLKGSRSALETFKAHCGWTAAGFRQNLERTAAANPEPTTSPQDPPQAPETPEPTGQPAFSQTVFSRVAPLPDAQGAFWFAGNGFGGGSPKNLRYGIPETDAVALYASCEDFNVKGVLLELYTSFGNVGANQQVTIQFNHAAGSPTFAGTTFVESEEYAGIRTIIPKDRALWERLAQSQNVSFGIQGQPPAQVGGSSGQAALLEFYNLCRQ